MAIFVAAAVLLGFVELRAPGAVPIDRNLLAALLGGGGILLLVGMLDDRRGVRPRTKLAGQVLAALAALALGVQPDMPWVTHPALDGLLFVGWVLAVTNAFNLIDGMDGLAASMGIVALVTVGVYCTQLGNTHVLLPAVVLTGALIGFLRHNLAPASVFLGDSGSLFVGYVIALLSLEGAARDGAAVSLLMPICALPVPVLDTVAAIVRRWLRHVPLSSPDARHIHHRLGSLGYGPRGVVTMLFVISCAIAAFGIVAGLASREASLAVGIFGALVMVPALLYGSSRLAYHEFNEAVNLLLVAPKRARLVIRAQIVVRDIAHELASIADEDSLRRHLATRGPALGLERLDVVDLEDRVQVVGTTPPGALTLVLPLAVASPRRCGILVSGRCRPLVDSGVAERVARGLAPHVERWMAERAVNEELAAAAGRAGRAVAERTHLGTRTDDPPPAADPQPHPERVVAKRLARV
jgi:UDP-GlcNAc:undecaprenyl-phosphate GlcNAc-1-phosphate transferase